MATIGSAKATLVNKIDTLTASATAKDTIYLAKALKENTTHHSFTFQGAWAATTAYALDDVVTTSGKTYICIVAHTSGASFAVGSNWSLMAEKGTDGTDGTDLTSTLTTAGDVVYKGASALTRLAKGTASQVLTMNSGATAPEWADAASGGFTSSTFLDQGTLFSRDSANTLSIPDLGGVVDGTLVEVTATTKALNTSGNWDGVGSYETASNRAGKDFYVYLLSAGGVILSNSSTYPSGYTAANSRKIAGFHCLAVAVGTISGHSLTGYAQGDILPRSVWDRFNRPISAPEGMVLSDDGMWVDIYLPSYSGTLLKSVNGGTIADGSNGWHGYKFEQWFGDIGKKLIRQTEFVTASIGANQGTNIAGSADPSTTTGHTDTAGRRMISNIGCEDIVGVMGQWSRDLGGVYSSGTSWVNAYDGNDSGVAGSHHNAPYRAMLGGWWDSGSGCGSRFSEWDASPLATLSSKSGRGVSEPAANRL